MGGQHRSAPASCPCAPRSPGRTRLARDPCAELVPIGLRRSRALSRRADLAHGVAKRSPADASRAHIEPRPGEHREALRGYSHNFHGQYENGACKSSIARGATSRTFEAVAIASRSESRPRPRRFCPSSEAGYGCLSCLSRSSASTSLDQGRAEAHQLSRRGRISFRWRMRPTRSPYAVGFSGDVA